ncbi:MAG: hybrid sensor histidine kinase/response regulator [Gammaproteobacteria bacterium]|nr:hybrid sensor histidine kinase/response regulator [Gammaproteobacteria bacterium]
MKFHLHVISPVQSSGKVRLPNPATGVAEAETSATESTDDESLGHECHVANDGLEALAVYDQFTFDIIFMDIVMPNMDGLTAAQEIRKREEEKNLRRTPIVAITANVSEEDQQKGQAAGIDEYIAKPFVRAEIYAKLAVLENSEANVKKGEFYKRSTDFVLD